MYSYSRGDMMPPVTRGEFHVLLAIVAFLNLFDLLSTLQWCKIAGVSIEMNPLMLALLTVHPVVGVAYKAFAVALFIALMLISARHNYLLASRGTLFTACLYTALFFWHLAGPFL